MNYDEKEQELKAKNLKRYWDYVYANYCAEKEKKISEEYKASMQSFGQAFEGMLNIEDEDPERMKKAAEIVKTSLSVHNQVKQVEDLRMEAREKLAEIVKEKPESLPETIRKSIEASCEAFVNEQDKTKLAAYGATILEHLDAMYADPALAAKVCLSDEQMRMAAKIITIGGIIQEGMKSLEMELNDSGSPNPQLTEVEHQMNITKIAAMEQADRERLSGNMIQELQNCDLMKKYAAGDRFELAADLANSERRRALSVSLVKSIEPAKPQEPSPKTKVLQAQPHK